MARIREHFLATTLCVLWACLTPAHAEPLRAGIRLAPADRSLLARVRGQTGDLDVALEAFEAPIEPVLAAQLESARALANEHGLRVLIWAVRKEGALELVVADFALDRVLVRPLSSSFELSAQEEAAALVTRSALRASLAGSALGTPSEDLVPAPAPEPVPAAPPPSPEPKRYTLELGALSGLDGVSARGHHTLFVRAVWQWRRIELGLLGGYGVPIPIDERLASLHLRTHRVEASAGRRFLSEAWSLTPSLAFGARVLRLTAESRAAQLQAADARLVTLALGAFVRLAYQPARFGLSLRLGLDVLPNAPTLGYRADRFRRTERMWTAQPHVGLALTY
ncbi:MAG TPA: hypothetical protein VFX59_26105 [Polyangiales bacterium]|nr:hypothetical protein [Polyangiales bacterium]